MKVLGCNGTIVIYFTPRITKAPYVAFHPLPAEIGWQADDTGIPGCGAAAIAVHVRAFVVGVHVPVQSCTLHIVFYGAGTA